MKRQRYRMPDGGRIDRSQPLSFTFNDRSYQGYAGDTLASALLANGVAIIGRSFKYHRPRGVFSAGAEEPNALVQLEQGSHTQPNLRATQIELYSGLKAESINCWPSVDFDLWSLIGLFGRIFPAGFYYKTFMKPYRLWPVYERIIRQAAGLGRAPSDPDPDRYENINTHCDILIIGGGPSGLSAALKAGQSGARVILADEQNEFGGALLGSDDEIDGGPALDWVENTVCELEEMAEVRLLPRTTIYGYYNHNFLTAVERVTDHLGVSDDPLPRQRSWRIRTRQVILASGAIERPMVFENNDRPGVMLASAASTYANRYGVCFAKRVVVFTNNDEAYRTALIFKNFDIHVSLIDVRPEFNGDWPRKAKAAGIEILSLIHI